MSRSSLDQADEFTEDHRSRSPHLVAKKVEIRVFDSHAFPHPRAAADTGRVAQVVERYLQHLLHLAGCGNEVRTTVGNSDDRVQSEPTDENVHRREFAENPDSTAIDPDLLYRFSQRRLRESLADIACAAGQTDLPRVSCQITRAHGQRHGGPIGSRIEQQQCSCGPCILGKIPRLPSVSRWDRREAHLRLDAG